MNVNNLKKFRDWLKAGNVKQDQFDMDYHNPKIGKKDLRSWATFVFPMKINDILILDQIDVSIGVYAGRVFKLSYTQSEFLFDHKWKDCDNTIEGAIGRLEVLIKYPDLFKNRLDL